MGGDGLLHTLCPRTFRATLLATDSFDQILSCANRLAHSDWYLGRVRQYEALGLPLFKAKRTEDEGMSEWGRIPQGVELGSDLSPEQAGTRGYCFKCRLTRQIAQVREVNLSSGRKAYQGVCPVCVTKIFRIRLD